MNNLSKSDSGPANQREALAVLSSQKEEINQHLMELEQQNHQLDFDEGKVEADAANVETRVRALAEEEAQLLRRKKALQEEARAIGESRTSLINRRKKLAREKESLLSKSANLEKHKSAIDQAQAYEEGQKSASIERTVKTSENNPCEKRTSDRVVVRVDVSMHTEHNFYMGLSENLSEGGLFIATYDHLAVGTQLDLTMSLPDCAPIKVVGIVRWAREFNQFTQDVSPGVGVQFSEIAEEDRKTIESFLKTRSPLFFET